MDQYEHDPERILICDDDPTLRRTIVKVLEKKNYSVTACENGSEALDSVEKGFYDLILLDIRMPDMDGIEVLEKIRSIQSGSNNSAIIIITGYASEDAPIKAIKLGASDYIKKPFDLQTFLMSIERNISLVRANKEKDFFFQQMVEKSRQLKLNEKEIQRLKNIKKT